MATTLDSLLNALKAQKAAWKLDPTAVRNAIKALKTPYSQLCPDDLNDLAEAAFGPGHTVYYIGGDNGAEYKMTNMDTCVPVYLGSNMTQATRTLKRIAREKI
jgi:hypothetical protein